MEETLKLILDKLNSMDSDIKDMKGDLSVVKGRLNGVEGNLKELSNRAAVTENEHGAKLDALLDGYKQISEGQQEIKEEIRSLKQKQENQDIEIRVIKAAK